jgi:hypothetical protein
MGVRETLFMVDKESVGGESRWEGRKRERLRLKLFFVFEPFLGQGLGI